ncbi:MAG: class I SAM-dependent methyltransferase [Actinobacteria bacterium]|nr:class I SAM-dependent methyltransferase [Actinomycetota bacterium]MBI3686018.1 class I SAM-dependent methyltransferase [Actinomycetota bacterium]
MTAAGVPGKAGYSGVPPGSGEDCPGPGDEPWRTRPGTPMIGPYSVHQMDDFYAALAVGQVRPSGIMNYLQRLYIAERCPPGARVVDVCCGRGLQLPVLYRYAPHLRRYVGLDISTDNLTQARERVARLDEVYGGSPFPIDLYEQDVAATWTNDLGSFDVAVYTSALEHLPVEPARVSLRHVAQHLAPGGRLFLSTPNTTGPSPRPLQHRVHVYEWNTEELLPVLADCGLRVRSQVGLLPPEPDLLAQALADRYGAGAATWYRDMVSTVPAALLDALSATTVPDVAAEVLYVCERPA